MSGTMPRLLAHMLSRPVVVGAVKVSLFVGTCLNAINQGPAIWRGESADWSKLLLNYVVPYLVSSYSAAKARKALEG